MAELIHRWPLTADANDVVGSLNLTNKGSVTFSSDGASFNGSSQWLSFTKTLPSTFTLTTWVMPSAWGKSKGIYIADEGGGVESVGVYVPSSDAVLRAILGQGGGFVDVSSEYNSTKYPNNTHTLIAVTYDGTTLKMYRGATEIASSSKTKGTCSTAWAFGRLGAYSCCYYAGKQKDNRMYDYALSASEISAIAAAGPNPSAGPLRLAQVF